MKKLLLMVAVVLAACGGTYADVWQVGTYTTESGQTLVIMSFSKDASPNSDWVQYCPESAVVAHEGKSIRVRYDRCWSSLIRASREAGRGQ